MMVVAGIDYSNSTVRSMIIAGGVTSSFLTSWLWVNCFFLGLATVG